jgi:hypothetical protein
MIYSSLRLLLHTGLEMAVQLNEIPRVFARTVEIIAASDEPIGLDQAFDPNKGNRSGKPELKA